ncbi:MAG TPA: response regulator [Albitalea sp.]|uniref:response regulator n=1 Tax=Piscinibacter sp. TaxID=1903157 RepID=UPI002ED4BD06
MTRPSLLFVDDERASLTALRVVFGVNHDLIVTTDAHEAIALMKARTFHVIVCDQRMSAMGEVDVLRHARELSPHSIRLLLSGDAKTDSILLAINEVEVHRFLQKPWDTAKLKQVVDEAIDLARNFFDAAEPGQAPRSTAEVLPFPRAGRSPEPLPALDIELDDKETLLLIDPGESMVTPMRVELEDKVRMEHAASRCDALRILRDKPVGVVVFSFDVRSQEDGVFVRMLKREHPSVLVVAVCDSIDTVRLIELIDEMKIFRYVRRPVNMKILSHYVMSAVRRRDETRRTACAKGEYRVSA